MKNLNQKKPDGRKSVMAAVTGAIVGAGIAVAGAVALNNKKGEIEKRFADGKEKAKKIATVAKDAEKEGNKAIASSFLESQLQKRGLKGPRLPKCYERLKCERYYTVVLQQCFVSYKLRPFSASRLSSREET